MKWKICDLDLQYLRTFYFCIPVGRPKGSLGKNSKKKVKDVNKPKRATSAYFFFLAQCRKEAAKAGKAPTKVRFVCLFLFPLDFGYL